MALFGEKQRRGRRIHIRRERIQPADHQDVQHHSGGTPAARHSVLHPDRRTPDVQLSGDAAQQDFTRNMSPGFGIHRQTGDIRGAEQNGDHPMRRFLPAVHPLPAMAHPRHAKGRSGPPTGIGKPDKICEPVQPDADHLHSGTGHIRRETLSRRYGIQRHKRLLRTDVPAPESGRRQTGERTFRRFVLRVPAAREHRPDGKPDRHLSLLLQTAGHLFRSDSEPLVPDRPHRHLLSGRHRAAQGAAETGLDQPQALAGARRGQHRSVEMRPEQPHHPLRHQQTGQSRLRRGDPAERSFAFGKRRMLFLEDTQGGPRPHTAGLRRPDSRPYGQGLRRVPRDLQRKRTLAHGMGRGAGGRGVVRPATAPKSRTA